MSVTSLSKASLISAINVPHEITLCIGYLSGVLEAMQSADASPTSVVRHLRQPRARLFRRNAGFHDWAQRHPEHGRRDRSSVFYRRIVRLGPAKAANRLGKQLS